MFGLPLDRAVMTATLPGDAAAGLVRKCRHEPARARARRRQPERRPGMILPEPRVLRVHALVVALTIQPQIPQCCRPAIHPRDDVMRLAALSVDLTALPLTASVTQAQRFAHLRRHRPAAP